MDASSTLQKRFKVSARGKGRLRYIHSILLVCKGKSACAQRVSQTLICHFCATQLLHARAHMHAMQATVHVSSRCTMRSSWRAPGHLQRRLRRLWWIAWRAHLMASPMSSRSLWRCHPTLLILGMRPSRHKGQLGEHKRSLALSLQHSGCLYTQPMTGRTSSKQQHWQISRQQQQPQQ